MLLEAFKYFGAQLRVSNHEFVGCFHARLAYTRFCSRGCDFSQLFSFTGNRCFSNGPSVF